MLPKFFGIYTYSLILCRSRLKAKMATKCCRLPWSSPWLSPSFSSFWRQCFLHFTSQKVRECFRLNLRASVWKWKELFLTAWRKEIYLWASENETTTGNPPLYASKGLRGTFRPFLRFHTGKVGQNNRLAPPPLVWPLRLSNPGSVTAAPIWQRSCGKCHSFLFPV